jgi:sterol desaturase/sphingolipid hydroxylase (fatty acid hydroxylase superfamily)
MDKNFGIGLAFFDWVFGTMTMVEPPFNRTGLEAAAVTSPVRRLKAATQQQTRGGMR